MKLNLAIVVTTTIFAASACSIQLPTYEAHNSERPPFTFQVERTPRFIAQSSDGNLSSVKLKNGTKNYNSGQILVNLTDSKHLEDVLSSIDGEVMEQLIIPPRPSLSRDNSGRSSDLANPSESIAIPSYLIRLRNLDKEDVSDFSAMANEIGISGNHKFSSHIAAATFYKCLKARKLFPNTITHSAINTINDPQYTTNEGKRTIPGALNEVSPNGSSFWYTASANEGGLGAVLNYHLYPGVWDYAPSYQHSNIGVIDSGFQGSSESRVPEEIANLAPWTYNTLTSDYSIAGASAPSGDLWHGRRVASMMGAAPLERRHDRHFARG